MIALVLLGCTAPPTVCADDRGPRRLVNRFWGTLDAEYAVFDARLDGSWEAVGEEACNAVSGNPDSEAVFDALLGMARALDDGHIQLEGGSRDADGWRTVWPHYERHEDVRTLAEERFGPLQTVQDGAIAWGQQDGVGYIALDRLDEFSGMGSEAGDLRVFEETLDDVFADFDGVDAWVVDLRFNEGGWDALGLVLAGRFADESYVAWRTQQRDGPAHSDLTEPEDTRVEPAQQFSGPVRVLTSGGTFSAGETAVLALRELEQVMLVGERTSGHLSDLYDAGLPRLGWRFTYSGDRYTTAAGEGFEAVGIPPDIEVPFDVEGGTDAILEAALSSL